jgi:hypothetical protein
VREAELQWRELVSKDAPEDEGRWPACRIKGEEYGQHNDRSSSCRRLFLCRVVFFVPTPPKKIAQQPDVIVAAHGARRLHPEAVGQDTPPESLWRSE